jgi:HEPN domain-containing protein
MVEPASDLVKQWVQKAEEDWEAAQLLVSHQTQAAATCFHCQQCAEKLLKSALLAAGHAIPKVHDLSLLSSLLSERAPHWTWDSDALEDLTSGAVASCYPGYAIDSNDAAESILQAGELRLALLRRLGLDPTK